MNQHFGLVRDGTTGKPKVDDPATLHPIQLGMMTEAERLEFGLHPGPYAIDAQGVKKLEKVAGGFKALEPLVACNVVIDLPAEADAAKIFRVFPRGDTPIGQTIAGTLTEE